MERPAIAIETGPNDYTAYVPDLPGCVTPRQSVRETGRGIREAIELRLEGLRKDGEPIPERATKVACAGIPPFV